MTAVLLFASAMLIALAVFYALAGNKLPARVKSVRYKDQRIETRAAKRSSRDTLVILAGSAVSAGIALAVTGTWYYTLAGSLGGYFVFKWWKAKQENQRMELLQSQFLEVLEQIESATYGGLNPYQAIEDSVPNMPRPARDIFYEVLRRVRTGSTLAEAIDSVRKDTGWDDLKVLSVAMNLYNQIGCDLSVVCQHALESYEEKENSRGAITAAIAQNMMSLKILTALPFVIVGAARAMSPAFAYPLFHTVEGGIVFAFAVLWVTLGNIITRKMITSTLKGV